MLPDTRGGLGGIAEIICDLTMKYGPAITTYGLTALGREMTQLFRET